MKAISIRQPWAWLICKGYKNLENRSWPTKFRGRVYVHAGRTIDDTAWSLIKRTIDAYGWVDVRMADRNGFPLGAIIGEVDIIDCVTCSSSPWFFGPYGFVLANPVLYEKPIPYKGRLGFFEVQLNQSHSEASA